MKTIYEETGGTYTEISGCLIPNLVLRESTPIGKWGKIRREYLKEQHPLVYSELLLSEKLYPHLIEIDHTCDERLALLVQQIARQENVTEALKAADQMGWVRRMNSIQSRAEEIVMKELIYIEEGENAGS